MREVTWEEAKELQMNMTNCFHSYCEENGLSYQLGYGSLLGAIRHKGYIPWDDDIDVFMPRPDYEKFCAGFNHNRTDSLEFVDYRNTPGYTIPFGKIVDRRTSLMEKSDHTVELGVNIDVYPVDNLSDDYKNALRLFRQVDVLWKMLSMKVIVIDKKRSFLKNAVLFAGKVLLAPVSCHSIIAKMDRIAQKYPAERYTDYVCCLMGEGYGTKEILRGEWMRESMLQPFENTSYWIPKGYDGVLTNYYGDYMTPPPADKQMTHHANVAYWKD